MEEVVADEVCDTRIDADGDLEQTCTWAVIFRGAGDAVQARSFGRVPAEVSAFLNSDDTTFTAASTNPGRTVLMGILAPAVWLLGSAFMWQGIRPLS